MRSIERLPNDAELSAVERLVEQAIVRECQAFNRKKPEVVVVAYERDPALAASIKASMGWAVGRKKSSDTEGNPMKSRKKAMVRPAEK